MRQQRSRYKPLQKLSSKDTPPREEIEWILQENSLEYDLEMTREKLWDIWVNYFNARYQLISSLSCNNEDRQQVFKKIDKNYCTNYKNCSNI
ncbi:hypothetical protein CR203_11830 [Salipaludibacillus neizhouensis]|uniref:Uncharacterized protein n=1 Tax=Salipaludibacillus neizhouensis TaxID=885475 RepID=A0A3A9K9I6_9BACI|nr:hypothetical protein CR203_11830 [Salipaludibacillus neizhouensis]